MSELGVSPAAGASSGVLATSRLGARVIVRDGAGRLLLFQGADPASPAVLFWFTPGGGLDAGESFEEAAGRELREEAGFELTRPGKAVREEEVEFSYEGVTYRQRQRYFAVELAGRGDDVSLDLGGWTEFERRSLTGYRWWTLDEIAATGESVYPPDLVDLVRSIEAWGSAEPA